MKSSKTILLLIALTLSLGVASSAYAKEVNFAYVDVAKLFDEYQRTKDNDRDLQEKGRQKEEERDAIVHEVRQLKDELALLSDDARKERQGDLETKLRNLQQFDAEAKQELGQKRQDVVKEIFTDIDETVQRYGERKGIDFVLNERALLYHNARYDVTEEILKELNRDYEAKK